MKARLEAAGFDVAVPDLDGGDFESLTVSGQLEVLERTAGGKPVDLIGSSMGGYLAALYAARRPEVRKLALLAPAFDFSRRWAESFDPERLSEWRRTGVTSVFHYAQGRHRPLGYQIVEDAAIYEPFPDFRQPALIFHGAHDDVVPPDVSRKFADSHPDVHFEMVDSGHDLLNVMDRMAAEIAEFFSQPVATRR